jgi:hypothetical protein
MWKSLPGGAASSGLVDLAAGRVGFEQMLRDVTTVENFYSPRAPLLTISLAQVQSSNRRHAMSDITPELVAEALKHQLMPVPLAARPILLEAITSLITKQVDAERTRCRALCEQRAELWRNTKSDASPLAQEARSRANEATYLADLLH